MKKYLLTGLIILLPLVITLLIIIFLVNLFTAPFITFTTAIIEKWNLVADPAFIQIFSKILTLISLIFIIFFLGIIGRWFLIKSFLKWTDALFSKIPVVKTIYKTIKDIARSLFSAQEKKAFLYPVLTTFPSQKSQTIGFVSGEIPQEIQKHFKDPLVSIFVPTAPHPISGYLVIMNKIDAKKIQMSNEDAFKFIISCGVIISQGKESHAS